MYASAVHDVIVLVLAFEERFSFQLMTFYPIFNSLILEFVEHLYFSFSLILIQLQCCLFLRTGEVWSFDKKMFVLV